jgi:hypothetical protein
MTDTITTPDSWKATQARIAEIRRHDARYRERLRAEIQLHHENAQERIARLRRQEEQQHESKAFRMFDSITLDAIPTDARAVAGYTSGFWPTYPQVVARWPKAKHLSIAVTSSHDADCLDVEPGDASPADAPSWLKRQTGDKPVVYTSVSLAQGLIMVLAKARIKRDAYRLWTAHYTDEPHRCTSACGFNFRDTADATQFTDRSAGKNLDESLCVADFL